jgi:hypothetical protein
MTPGIEFDEDRGNYTSRMQQGSQPSSKMASWLIQHGFAKTPAGAQVILICLAVVNLILCFVVIKYFL